MLHRHCQMLHFRVCILNISMGIISAFMALSSRLYRLLLSQLTRFQCLLGHRWLIIWKIWSLLGVLWGIWHWECSLISFPWWLPSFLPSCSSSIFWRCLDHQHQMPSCLALSNWFPSIVVPCWYFCLTRRWWVDEDSVPYCKGGSWFHWRLRCSVETMRWLLMAVWQLQSYLWHLTLMSQNHTKHLRKIGVILAISIRLVYCSHCIWVAEFVSPKYVSMVLFFLVFQEGPEQQLVMPCHFGRRSGYTWRNWTNSGGMLQQICHLGWFYWTPGVSSHFGSGISWVCWCRRVWNSSRLGYLHLLACWTNQIRICLSLCSLWLSWLGDYQYINKTGFDWVEVSGGFVYFRVWMDHWLGE